MIKINLLHEQDFGLKERFYDDLIFLVIGLAATIVILYSMSKELDAEMATLEASYADLQRKAKDQEIIEQKLKEYEGSKAQLEQQVNTINQLKQEKSGPVKMLEDFALLVPEKVWIERFVDKNLDLEISGYSLGEEAIADFVLAMKNSPHFSDVTLLNVDVRQFQKVCEQTITKTHSFKITARAKYRKPS